MYIVFIVHNLCYVCLTIQTKRNVDEENCEECGGILEELEIIDGEADLFGIDMVKISDPDVASKYNIISLPSLVYFRKRVPEIFDGKKLKSWAFVS